MIPDRIEDKLFRGRAQQRGIAERKAMIDRDHELSVARQAKMVDIARTLNPGIEILLRTHSDEEAELMQRENLGTVFMGEQELARAMTRQVLMRMGAVVDERAQTPTPLGR